MVLWTDEQDLVLAQVIGRGRRQRRTSLRTIILDYLRAIIDPKR